ncbi:putative extracellular serine carboxypeptidase [Podosphaera aphanis]|nr:putative extracellular serine carboxypeptidase [Podosphaera aphanis]
MKLSIAISFVGAALAYNAIEKKARKTTIPNNRLLSESRVHFYPPNYLAVPVDHFHNDSLYEPHSNENFNLRYWFDATHYKSGGPVIVLQSGETSGLDRLSFLRTGILHHVTVATNGIGVVLEHRYYGTSIPTKDFSTENLRFLTTAQALADQAYFAQNVKFPGLEHLDLTAPNVAYIAYGGSYAGGFVAFLRKIYPDIFWGAISSSGVIEAIYDYWSYYEPIRSYGEKRCISNTQKLIHVVDNILLEKNEPTLTAKLKSVFGLPNVTHDDDFAEAISLGIASWQGRNWDPKLNDFTFDFYCSNITATSVIYPDTLPLKNVVEDLLISGGYKSEVENLKIPWLNWIGWLNQTSISACTDSQEYCFSTHNTTFYEQDDIHQDWRAWPYQVCTQWGYFQTGSGVPHDQLPLVSRTNTLEWNMKICNDAFNITTPPNVRVINKYGGFSLSYPRLAMIDGEQDPWRPATAHASPFNTTALNRTNTLSEPFILIPGAVHHWDENSRLANNTMDSSRDSLPPLPIREVQKQEIHFVLDWMREWGQERFRSQEL